MEIFFALLTPPILTFHLVCVNIASVGPLFAMWLEVRAHRTGLAAPDDLGKSVARLSLKILIPGIVTGLMLGLQAWWRGDSAFFSALSRIPSGRLSWGVAELFFYFLCMIPYALSWDRLRRWRYLHRSLAILAATNLMYHFPPLFLIVSKLAGQSGTNPALDAAGFRKLMTDPEILSRVVHHLLAAVAVGGVLVMYKARRACDRPTYAESDKERQELSRCVRLGAWTALIATVLQVPIGVWVVLELSALSRDNLLAGDWLATSLFIAALVVVLALLHSLLLVAVGDRSQSQVVASAGLILLIVLLMTSAVQRLYRRPSAPNATASLITPPHVSDGIGYTARRRL